MKKIYIITLQNDKEYAFEDFNLLDRFIKPLQNGTFYFRKIKVLESDKSNKNLYLVSSQNEEYGFEDMEQVTKFISPLPNGSFFFRKAPIIKTEAALQTISQTQQTQNQPE